MSASLQLLSREELNARLPTNTVFLDTHEPWWSTVILLIIALALVGAAAFPWWPAQWQALIPTEGEMPPEAILGLVFLAFVFIAGKIWTLYLNKHGNSLLMAITTDVLYVRLKVSFFSVPKTSDKSFLALPRHDIASINLFEGMKHQRTGSKTRSYYSRLIDFHLKQPLPNSLSNNLAPEFRQLAETLARGQTPALLVGPSGAHLRLNIPTSKPSLKELLKLLQGLLFAVTHQHIKQAGDLS
jgi:hypothetical protein